MLEKEILSIFIIISFYYIGFKFPDIDLKIKALGHRSIVTHSFIIPLGMLLLDKANILSVYYRNQINITHILIEAFALGITLHLIYDLKPKSYKGSALLKLPIISGGLSKIWSIIIIILSIIILSMITIFSIGSLMESITLIILIILTILKNIKVESNIYGTIIISMIIIYSMVQYSTLIKEIINGYIIKYLGIYI